MYDSDLTSQSLPNERYLHLLGVAISVFSSNNSFIIENIIRTDSSVYNWGDLIDLESGNLRDAVKKTISRKFGTDIEELFFKIVAKRNRIIHGYRITSASGEQILATKEKNSGTQFEITEQYLIDFIKDNEALSNLLYQYRGF